MRGRPRKPPGPPEVERERAYNREYARQRRAEVVRWCSECGSVLAKCARSPCLKCRQAARVRERFETRLWVKYKLELEDWARMYEAQNGRCAICAECLSFEKNHVHVDHCHKTGRVRGLLCRFCNVALGSVFERVETLRGMIAYLLLNS